MEIILASSSKYRRALLQRLNLDFTCHSPNIDETINENFSLEKGVLSIAKKKAQAISSQHPKALIIASDQLCSINNDILGKPGDFEKAFIQLKKASDNTVVFYTGLVIYNPKTTQFTQHCDKTTVTFRKLTDHEIIHYLHTDKPYDCAGSFKAESLGISLFKEIINTDPTALIGLPLIKLCEILRQNNVTI